MTLCTCAQDVTLGTCCLLAELPYPLVVERTHCPHMKRSYSLYAHLYKGLSHLILLSIHDHVFPIWTPFQVFTLTFTDCEFVSSLNTSFFSIESKFSVIFVVQTISLLVSNTLSIFYKQFCSCVAS